MRWLFQTLALSDALSSMTYCHSSAVVSPEAAVVLGYPTDWVGAVPPPGLQRGERRPGGVTAEPCRERGQVPEVSGEPERPKNWQWLMGDSPSAEVKAGNPQSPRWSD